VLRTQTTLKTSVSIEGVGLHSGHPVRATFRPAPAGHGIVFRRLDRPETAIPARVESASTFDYATTLSRDGVSVGTVEHVLSAAFGEGLDNCVIELDGPEVPILDGSALPFVRLFHAAGFERLDAAVRSLSSSEPVRVSRDGRSVSFQPDGPGLTITYEIDFPHPVVGRQELTVAIRPEEYSTRIAPARTFGFARDVEAMRARAKEPRIVRNQEGVEVLKSRMGEESLAKAFDDVSFHLGRMQRQGVTTSAQAASAQPIAGAGGRTSLSRGALIADRSR